MGCREGLPLPGIILIAPPGRGHLKQVTSCARARGQTTTNRCANNHNGVRYAKPYQIIRDAHDAIQQLVSTLTRPKRHNDENTQRNSHIKGCSKSS